MQFQYRSQFFWNKSHEIGHLKFKSIRPNFPHLFDWIEPTINQVSLKSGTEMRKFWSDTFDPHLTYCLKISLPQRRFLVKISLDMYVKGHWHFMRKCCLAQKQAQWTFLASLYVYIKVSQFQKLIFLFVFEPKTEPNCFLISALRI